MPTATPFKALGAGNGFPYCLSKEDVSGIEYWTTLGGNQKNGGVTESGKGLKQAMAILWNLEGVNLTAKQTETKTNANGTFTAVAELGVVSTDGAVYEIQPKDRACRGFSGFSALDSDSDPEVQPVAGASVTFVCNLENMVRFYNGPTDNEANFVGYGMSLYPGTDFLVYGHRQTQTRIHVSSQSRATTDVGYCTMSTNVQGLDIYFVCDGTGDTVIPSSAFARSKFTTGNSSSSTTGTRETHVQINSLIFYTY